VRPGEDRLIAPTESDRLAQLLPHATLLRYDDAGHGIIRQCAQRLNTDLLAHFKRARAPHPNRQV
jgi:pimeloyl-ACP methyl ester carboxylesterase